MTKTRADRYRSHTGAFDAPPEPKRARVRVQDIACPTCPAQVGEPCLTSRGTPTHSAHPSRRRMATRAANQSRDTTSADFVQTLTPARRAEVRLARGLNQSQAGEIFGLNGQSFGRMESGTRQIPDLHACAYGAWLRLWEPLTPTGESKP